MEDERFNIIGQDPRFRQMPKAERKVKIDRRFQGMFKDKQFKLKYSVDKRGRPLKATTDDNLRRFYEMSESDSDDEDGNVQGKTKTKKKKETTSAGKKTSNKAAISKFSKQKLKSANESEREKTTVEAHDKGTSKSNMKTFKLESKLKQKSTERKVKEVSFGEISKAKQQRNSSEEISDGANSSSSDESLGEEQDEKTKRKSDQSSSSSSSSSSDSESGYDESTKLSLPGPDLIRGEGNLESSSSSDSSSSDSDGEADENEEEVELEHGWGELDKDAPRDDRVTTRLAVCNMDWDRVKAQDILVLFNSFKPTGGVIKLVTIYPSEYGKERMKEEDLKGPLEMIADGPIDEDKKDTGEGDQYHRERLRKYQLQRLKYYYAVVECDSKATAGTLYEQCDGLEYQSSSTIIDLRFIPDEMIFDEQEAKDMATEMPDATLYKPVEFRTTALHQSKVELTWDETDHLREKKTIEAFGSKDLEEADVQAYLASSSGDEENDKSGPAFEIEEDDFGEAAEVDDETQISKYRSLLQGIDEKEKEEKGDQAELEISWEPGLKDTAEELVKKKMESGIELTPWEKYLEKKKEKNRKKREEKKQTSKEVNSGNVSVKKQGEEGQAAFSDDELPAGVDITDSFFKGSLTETESASKAGGGKKKRKQKKQSLTAEEMEEQQQKKAELQLLMMDEDDDKQHFNLKDIMEKEKKSNKKRKRKLREKEETLQEDNFKIDVKDPRFDAIYTSHVFSIDPSDSQYKRTKAMEELVKEKQQRRAKKNWMERNEETVQKKANKLEEKKSGGGKKNDQELSMLVKSIKNKTQQYNAKKSKKTLKR